MAGLQRKDIYLLSFLFLIVLLVFYPVCYTEYAYTDEINQLWNYKPGSNFTMFAVQGRWITELIVSKTFGAIDTIQGITYIRIFSLVMWLLCIPVWYVAIKNVVAQAPDYDYLPFFACLFLVTSLQFSISVQWASCVEMAIANTAGVLSGTLCYKAIRDKEKWLSVSVMPALGAAFVAMIALFTYQSGFTCFLIPFLLHYISNYTTRKDKVFIKGLAFYLAMYALYFVLFKLSFAISHLPTDIRAGFTDDPSGKITFFLKNPLHRAFWFNMIPDDKKNLPWTVSRLLLLGWMVLAFIRFGKKNWQLAAKYIVAVLVIFVLSYLPSLVVKESYASNRTMLAIVMCVFIVSCEMVMYLVKNAQLRSTIAFGVAFVLLMTAWYNFNRQFLQPVHKEYMAVKNYMQEHYNKGITTVYFIMSSQQAFEKEFHLQISMDEFGAPSTSFEWVPEDLTRQLVYEKTGNRETAKQLTVKYWTDAAEFARSGQQVTGNTLLVNMPELIDSLNP